MEDVAPPPNTPDFAAWLREQRARRGVAQEKLATAIGVDRKAPQRWERGLGISVRNYLAVVAYFGAEPAAAAVPADLTRRLAAVEAALDRLAVDVGEVRLVVERRDTEMVEAIAASVIAAVKGRRDFGQ